MSQPEDLLPVSERMRDKYVNQRGRIDALRKGIRRETRHGTAENFNTRMTTVFNVHICTDWQYAVVRV